jgi:hypothetical protein
MVGLHSSVVAAELLARLTPRPYVATVASYNLAEGLVPCTLTQGRCYALDKR